MELKTKVEKKLNISENCLKVLEKRYLLKDKDGKVMETPEGMFKRVSRYIAKADKLYSASDAEIKETENKFYEAMSSFKFMPNSPTLMNAGKDLGQLSACFTPDQIVITKYGPKRISEIKNGEWVLTHKNRFRKVTKMFVRKSNEIYILNAYKLPTETLKVTGEHPILAVKKGSNGNPAWIQIRDLSVGDYIAVSFPKEVIDLKNIKIVDFIDNNNLIDIDGVLYEKNTDTRYRVKRDGSVYVQDRNRSGKISQQVNPIKNIIEIDTDLMRLFGYYLSEGCVSDNNALRFVFSENERDYCEDILKIVKEKFGISSHIEETNSLDRQWLSIRFHSKILAGFIEGLFGTGYASKKIPFWIMSLPIEKQKGLLAGMFRGDSCTFKNGNNFCTRLVMCNMNLVYAAWQLVMRAGHFAALNFESMPKLGRVLPFRCAVSGRNGTKLMSELLNVDLAYKGRGYIRTIVRGDTFLTPITKIIKQHYQEEVYNLEVEDDHSYCANMVSVHNCFVLPIEDSMESIFDAIKNTAIVHKTGGGTGFNFSRLRPKNSVVRSTGGVSSGPVSFMKVFNAATQAVKQGGTRRGANMGILRVDHPDIMEFIRCKENDKEITNFNISIAVTEDFMNKVIADEEYSLIDPHNNKEVKKIRAKEVFDMIVELSWRNGEPGIIFIDRINKDNPTPKLGEIESTNPCVTGNTLVSTEHGLMRMDDIVKYFAEGALRVATDDRVQEILYSQKEEGGVALKTECGITFSSISRAFYSGKKEVFKLTTASGYELEATADHKIMTNEGWVKLIDLDKLKHKVLIQSGEGKFSEDRDLPFPVINDFIGDNGKRSRLNLPSEWSKELGQVLGWVVGDGWLREGDKNCRLGLTFSKDDKGVLSYFKPILNSWYGYDIKEVERENGVFHLSYHSKYFVEFFRYLGIKPWQSDEKKVPRFIYTAPREAVIGFLQGLFTADGTVGLQKVNNTTYVRLTAKSISLLKSVQLLLINLGIFSKIYDRSRPERKGFPYKNKNGEEKLYTLDGVCYELHISRDNIGKFLKKIGFLCEKHRNKVVSLLSTNFRNCEFEDRIKSIEKNGKKIVYDLTEPKTLSFITNGFISLDCGEQPLLPFESCNLGSINLSKVVSENGKKQVDWDGLRKLVHLGVHFLDNVIDMNRFPMKEIEKMTKTNRKIGLGVMGWADMLIKLEIPYNSEEAVLLGEKIMKFIYDEARQKSNELSVERGAFPSFKDSIFAKVGSKELRNATLTTIAPTGTISIISDASSGIEPLFALSYYRNVMDNDKLVEVNTLFEEVAKKEGFYSRKLMEEIAEKGSIKDIEGVPERYKKVFVTSHDIAPIWHIRMQALFQRYTDNAVSKTVNFSHNAAKDDVREVYMLAFKLGCKGVTIYRDKSREEQVLNINSNNTKKEVGEGFKPSPTDINENKSIAPRPRPVVTNGTTTKVATGCGNLYITINVDDRSLPFEVFIQMGKAGGCAASQLEAIGRLVSLALRSGVENNKIVEQLRGIRCPSPSWEKSGRIFSCSDAIARVLELRLGNGKMHHQEEALEKHSPHTMIEDKMGTVVGVCPDCGAALRHEEGCVVCRSCGYSKC